MKRLFTQTFLENSLKTTPTNILLQNRKNTFATPYVGILLMLLLCLFKVEKSNGQNPQTVTNYSFIYKNNHYIPLAIDDFAGDYLLAGTEGDFEGDVRVMEVDGTNPSIVNFSYLYHDNLHNRTCVDFTKVIDNNGVVSYYVTCLRRANWTLPFERDCIEILKVDNTGALVDDYKIDCSYEFATTPVHTMQNPYNGLVYICGYLSEQYGAGLIDDENTHKYGFVLSLDPNLPVPTNMQNGVLVVTWPEVFITSTSTWTPIGINQTKFYDMVIRTIPTPTGVYVTGNSNIIRDDGSGNGIVTSGTLNMELFNNLFPAPFKPNRPLGYATGNANTGEFGQSMNIDPSGLYYYISGNDFNSNSSSGNFPNATIPHFTAVDATTLAPVGGGVSARKIYNGIVDGWGLQTMLSQNYGTNSFLLAGMARQTAPLCGIPLSTSPSNYNPFIADINLSVSTGTLNATVNNSFLYPTNINGTGSSTLFNSYHNTWKWTFNNSWSCNLATQRDVVNTGTPLNNFALTGPVWDNTGYNQLNFKLLQGDQYGDVSGSGCPASVNCLPTNFSQLPIWDFSNASTIANFASYPSSSNYLTETGLRVTEFRSSSLLPATQPPNLWQSAANCSNWKPAPVAAIESIDNNAEVSLSPNPAHDQVKVNIKGKPETLKIWLCDMTGKTVAELYDGATLTLGTTILLPSFAPGLYLVHIIADGKNLSTQKLSIY